MSMSSNEQANILLEEKAVFAPPRKYLTATRLPSDLGLQAKELADDDRGEDIHSARERLAKLIVGRILVKLMIVSTLKKIS
jgi:hypothetical protein